MSIAFGRMRVAIYGKVSPDEGERYRMEGRAECRSERAGLGYRAYFLRFLQLAAQKRAVQSGCADGQAQGKGSGRTVIRVKNAHEKCA